MTLPQAYNRSIPQIAESAALVFQNTTIVTILGVLGPVGIAFAISGTFDWNSIVWELYIGIGFVYWGVSYLIMSYAKSFAQKRHQERHPAVGLRR